MDNKQRLDYLINKNYKHLFDVATNITKRHGTDSTLKYNLFHECYVLWATNIEVSNFYLETDLDFIRYCTKFLKQFYTWKKKDVIRKRRDNALFTFRANQTPEQIKKNTNIPDELKHNEYRAVIIQDETAQENIYLQSESINEITKLFLYDLISNDISIERGMIIHKMANHLKSVAKDILTEFEYDIFDLYFLQEMDCLEISKLYKMENTTFKELMTKRKHITPTYQKILTTQKIVKQKILDNTKWN